MEPLNLDTVRRDVAKRIEPYLKRLVDMHKSNLISIVLYGSATGDDFFSKSSDINLLVVFNELGFAQLNMSLRLVSEGIQKKIAAPLFLSLAHIETSKDVFPVEFIEIKENNILLYGRDLFKDMLIEERHTRLFCEQQLKGKLIRLRQAYLEVGLRKKGIEALMKESLRALMPVFRAMLRIKGLVPSVRKEGIVSGLAKAFGISAEVFLAILRDKRDDEKIAGQDVAVYFEKYIGEIKKLAIAADKL